MTDKTIEVELKSFSADEPGSFTGKLSTYGPPADLTGDIVQAGAFSKTLQEKGNIVPLYLGHDTSKQVGILRLHDTPTALEATGKINLDTPLGRDTHSNLLFNAKHGVKNALSIGFRTIKDRMEGSTRFLTELSLAEGSLTLHPANELALVNAVKSEVARRKDETLIGLMEDLKNSFRKGIDAR